MVVRFWKKKLIEVDDANPFREEQFLNGSSSIFEIDARSAAFLGRNGIDEQEIRRVMKDNFSVI